MKIFKTLIESNSQFRLKLELDQNIALTCENDQFSMMTGKKLFSGLGFGH